MNLVSLQNRIVNGKWMLERRELYSFYDTVQNLSNIKVGGLQSLIFGNPLVAKMQDHPVQTSSGVSSAGDMAIIQVSGILTNLLLTTIRIDNPILRNIWLEHGLLMK